jgi:hypothetical protein
MLFRSFSIRSAGRSMAAVVGLAAVATLASGAPATTHATKSAKKTTGHAPRSAPAYVAPPLAPGDTLVARIGDRNITLERFRAEWDRLPLSQRPVAPDQATAYKVFLDDLVDRDLLALEAQRIGEKLTPDQQADVDSLWHAMAKNQMFIGEVEKRVVVDSTQVERFRSQLQKILFLLAYVFKTREQAQAWYTKIVMGTPISKLEAFAKTTDPGAPDYVDLGHKIREDFNTETANIVFSLAPGRLSAPVQTAQGWALIELLRVQQRPNAIAGGSREGVIKEMRRMQAATLKEVYRDSLARSVHIVYREAAMDTILNRFLLIRERTGQNEGGVATFNMFQPLPVYQPGDSALVLATSDAGRVTGGDLYRFLASMGDIERPEIRSYEQLRPWVDRVAFDQLLLREALAKGYDRDPRVLLEVQLRRERYQVEGLYADSISNPVRISEAEARAAYEADTMAWMEHETVKMWVCAAPTKAGADSLIRVGQNGGNLKEIAKLTQLSLFVESGGVSDYFVREQCPTPSATDSIFKTPVGKFGGPIASNEGWVFFKVLDHKPDRMRPYSEVHDDVMRSMRNDREETATQLLLGRLRQRYPVVKHEEWLVKMAGGPTASN